MSKKMPLEPYKGVRDFYPEDWFVEQYIFDAMARACELFGYEEYSASILEPADLYRAKGAENEELVNEQTYTFTDRGDREVTLRPEMTPTVARMVAAKRREFAFPLRWFSIPNCFRYERPQRGRLREFWQLNADIFGVPGVEAEAEIIALAHRVMLELGATEDDFEIRVSDRGIINLLFDALDVDPNMRSSILALLDRRAKISASDFNEKLGALLGNDLAMRFVKELDATSTNAHIEQLRGLLALMDVHNMVVDTSIVRGFDYYTGMVFEVFDTSGENTRALFGGGRYDNLLSSFGHEPVAAVGFGMGDVATQNFLETHNLTPAYTPVCELSLCVLDTEALPHAVRLAHDLREQDVTVSINYSGKRVAEQLKHADKLNIPYVICIGAEERESGTYTLKHLASGDEIQLSADRIAEHLFSAAG